MRILSAFCLVLLLGCHSRDETTAEQKERLPREYAEADRKMNELYAELLKAGDEENRQLLNSSQKAWLQYRDAEYNFRYDQWRGGSIARLFAMQRAIDLTRRRIADFQTDLHPENE